MGIMFGLKFTGDFIMSDKERVQGWINTIDSKLAKLPTLRLGMLLDQCYYGYIGNQIGRNSWYQLNGFHFSIYSHDTGVSTQVKLVAPDGEELEIINRTYWYNESQYGFNKYTHLYGAWDKKLEETIQEIRNNQYDYLMDKKAGYEKQLADIKQEEKNKKDKFAAMFQ